MNGMKKRHIMQIKPPGKWLNGGHTVPNSFKGIYCLSVHPRGLSSSAKVSSSIVYRSVL